MAELGFKFSHDWFSHNIPNWKKWLRKYKGKSSLSFLELGCYEGMATRWLLDNILTRRRSVITVVDTFKGSIEHRRMDNSRIFDDYGWKKYPKTSNLHPKTAIDAFLKMYEGEYKLIAMDYQVCIMKTVK